MRLAILAALLLCFPAAAQVTNTFQRQINGASKFGRDILPLETADQWRAKLGAFGTNTSGVTSFDTRQGDVLLLFTDVAVALLSSSQPGSIAFGDGGTNILGGFDAASQIFYALDAIFTNLGPNSLTYADTNHELQSVTLGTGLTFSAGLLSVNRGSQSFTNTFIQTNEVQEILLTNNIEWIIAAWGGPTNNLSFGPGRQQFTLTTSCSITGFVNMPGAGRERGTVLTLTNSDSSDHLLYLPGGVTTDDGALSYTVTNQSKRAISLRIADTGTDAVSRPFFH